MIKLALFIVFLFVLCLMAQHSFKKNGMLINHYLCFSLGYLYYCLLPIFILEGNIAFGDSFYLNTLSMYKRLQPERVCTYIALSFLLYCSFILGCKSRVSYRFINREKPDREEQNLSYIYIDSILYLIMLFLMILSTFRNRNVLFRGYTTDSYGGNIAAYLSLLFSVMLLCFVSTLFIFKLCVC